MNKIFVEKKERPYIPVNSQLFQEMVEKIHEQLLNMKLIKVMTLKHLINILVLLLLRQSKK